MSFLPFASLVVDKISLFFQLPQAWAFSFHRPFPSGFWLLLKSPSITASFWRNFKESISDENSGETRLLSGLSCTGWTSKEWRNRLMRVHNDFIFSRKPQILKGHSHPACPSTDSKKISQNHFFASIFWCVSEGIVASGNKTTSKTATSKLSS